MLDEPKADYIIMFCPNCGREQQAGERYCANCGTEYENKSTVIYYVKKDKPSSPKESHKLKRGLIWGLAILLISMMVRILYISSIHYLQDDYVGKTFVWTDYLNTFTIHFNKDKTGVMYTSGEEYKFAWCEKEVDDYNWIEISSSDFRTLYIYEGRIYEYFIDIESKNTKKSHQLKLKK